MAQLAGLGGQPGSIRTSARSWSAFGAAARAAVTDLTGVQTDQFVGTEGDTYRGRISQDLVPHLEVTAQAWEIVGTALTDYANGLEDLQSRMASVQTALAQQQPVVNQAWRDWQDSVGADLQHGVDGGVEFLTGGLVDLDPDSDGYTSQTPELWSRYQRAKGDLDDIEGRAAGIRSEHATLLQTCCGKIDQAKGLRPVDPPNWLQATGNFFADGWNAAMDWVAENAEVLGVISQVLQTISGIAGLLAMIPCLTPIMAPIALGTGLASLAINVVVSAATGEWDVVGLGLQALSLVPFIRPLAMAGRAGAVSSAAATAASSGTRASLTALNQAQAAYNRMNTAFQWIGLGADVLSTGLTTVQTYQQTGDPWQAALAGGVSALGTSIPNTPHDIGALQNVIASSAGFVHTGFEMVMNPEPPSWRDWVGLGLSGAGAVMHYSNAYNYQDIGTTQNGGANPNGVPTGRFEKPDYVGIGTVNPQVSGTAGTVRHSALANGWVFLSH